MTDTHIIDAGELVDALRARGLEVRWEQTGGGVGTIYVGPWAYAKGEDDGPFAAALIGPGNYYEGTLTTHDLAIGQDASYDPTYDDGGTFSWYTGEQVPIAALVATTEVVVDAATTRWASNLFITSVTGP